MKPIILTTASVTDDEKFLKISRAYTEAIEASGGIAVIPDASAVQDIPKLLSISDGVLLTGGVDVDPYYFGEMPVKEIGEISPLRDAFEIELTMRAVALNMPILAICRGIQVLNIALGGKVYQDIYSQIKVPPIKHSQEMPRHYASHSVQIKEGTILIKVFENNEVWVNSIHHQAVSEPADGFKIAAVSPDGVIEAIEHAEMDFCVGIQWHPEAMFHKYPEQLQVFKEFIRSSQNSIKKRVK